MPFKKDMGELSAMGVPFLHVKHELCSFRAYTVIVCRNRKLVDKRIGIFLFQVLGQLQFNGHPSLIIAQIPDAFSQNGINHRPDLTLSSSVTTRQSSNKFGFALAAPSLHPECARWNQNQSSNYLCFLQIVKVAPEVRLLRVTEAIGG